MLLNAGGYLAIWSATKAYFDPPYWLLLILALVACNGQTWFETAALVTCVQNFETDRQASKLSHVENILEKAAPVMHLFPSSKLMCPIPSFPDNFRSHTLLRLQA